VLEPRPLFFLEVSHMAWFWNSRQSVQLRELQKQVRQLTQVVSQLASQQHQPAGFDPATFLTAAGNASVQQMESTTGFMRMIHEVAVERAGAALGRRGGQRRAQTARRDERGRMLPGRMNRDSQKRCRLCRNPLTASFSVTEWEEHQKHTGGFEDDSNGSAAVLREQEPIEVDVTPAPAPRAQPTYPLPDVIPPAVDGAADRASVRDQPEDAPQAELGTPIS
jgi:hypothetical protein